jgi:uncharacterized membrane protein
MVEISAMTASPMILLGLLLIALAVVFLVWIGVRLSFVFRIRAEYPELGAWDSVRNSWVLTKSNGKKILGVSMSFIVWYVLAAVITLITKGYGAVAFLPVIVYDATAQTALYHDLSKRDQADDVEFPSLDPDDYDPNEAQW